MKNYKNDNLVALDDQDRIVIVNFSARKMHTVGPISDLNRFVSGVVCLGQMRRTWRQFNDLVAEFHRPRWSFETHQKR